MRHRYTQPHRLSLGGGLLENIVVRQSLWSRLTYRPVFIVNHYVRRICFCHKWWWQSWEEKVFKP